MTDSNTLQTLGAEARVALDAVTARDPRHLKTLASYLNAIEEKYRMILEELGGDEYDDDEEDDDDEDEEDPENPDADIIYNTRDFYQGGITTTFPDAPSANEGKISEVLLFPVHYTAGTEAFAVHGFTHKTSSRDLDKPGKLILDYGPKLDELKADPTFRGFKVFARMGDEEDGG